VQKIPPVKEVEILEHNPSDKEVEASIGGTIAKAILSDYGWISKNAVYRYLLYGEMEKQGFSKLAVIGQKMEKLLVEKCIKDCEIFECDGVQFRRRIDGVPLSAHIDGWGIDSEGKKFLIECKNYSIFKNRDYEYKQEKIQMRHYFNVLDDVFDYGILLVQYNTEDNYNKLIEDSEGNYWGHIDNIRVERDVVKEKDDLIIVKGWYNSHVAENNPPQEAKNANDLTQSYKIQNKQCDDWNIDIYLAEYKRLRKEESEIKEAKEKAKIEIARIMRDSEYYQSSMGEVKRAYDKTGKVQIKIK